MRRLLLLCVLSGLVACHEKEPPPPDVIATWRTGVVSLSEVEERLPRTQAPECVAARRGGGAVDLLVPCYRQIVNDLVIEKGVSKSLQDRQETVWKRLGTPGDVIRRQVTIATFYRLLRQSIEISDEAIEARFADDPGRFRRRGSLTLWNLFRRHEDPEEPQRTLEFLNGLKERVESGETFSELAREYSQSETRLRDGLVGTVSEDDLPPRLAEVAFALEDGEVSDPIAVRGGAVLLQARQIVQGMDLDLSAARSRIQQQLRSEQLEAEVEARVAETQLPADSMVLDGPSLLTALDSEDADAPVLTVGRVTISAAELRQQAGISEAVRVSHLDDDSRARLLTLYEGEKKAAILFSNLETASDPLALEVREKAQAQIEQAALAAVVEDELRSAMTERIDQDPDELRQYFEDNRHHYQSPLRFKLRLWSLPFGPDPPAQLKSMERAREQLTSGELSLDQAAEDLGGSIIEIEPSELEALTEIPPKGQAYLLQTESGGYTVPYQQDQALHMAQLVERLEPELLSYDDARLRVREDYLDRFQQRLRRQVVDDRLAEEQLVFLEDTLRQLLVGSPAMGTDGQDSP